MTIYARRYPNEHELLKAIRQSPEWQAFFDTLEGPPEKEEEDEKEPPSE